MTENIHSHPYILHAEALWQEQVLHAPEKHQRIFMRQLIYLFLHGCAEEKRIATRVLSCSINAPLDQFLVICFSTPNQAVSEDTGDYFAADPRSFFSTKVVGEAAAQGGSGPRKKTKGSSYV